MRFETIQNKIDIAKRLDFGSILDRSFGLFKAIWLKGFLMVLIMMILGFGISFLFITIGLIPNPYDVSESQQVGFFTDFYQSTFYNLPQTIIFAPISLGLLAGFYRMCKQADLKEPQDDDYFYFFKGNHLRKLLTLGLIYALIASVAQALFLFPYIYAFIPLSFFSVIFAFNSELSETEIVKLSFNLGTKKWLLAFGLIFLTGIIAMLGVLACFIGVFFTMSLVYIPLYFIYRDVVGFEDDDEIQLIGTE